ncbi:MAG: hypothetical protein ACOY3Y_17425 [Acidobacteriota bacterium]
MGWRFGAVAVVVALTAQPSWAQWMEESGRHGKGQGAIVVRDGAPVYEDESSTEVIRSLKRGDAVAGMHRMAIVIQYEFVEENGRVRVIYPRKGSSKPESGWMDPEDLSTFTYSCGCEDDCIPWAASFGPTRYNPCFQEARDEKLEKLRAIWAK